MNNDDVEDFICLLYGIELSYKLFINTNHKLLHYINLNVDKKDSL